RQFVAAPREILLRLEQLEPHGEPLCTCLGLVFRHHSGLLPLGVLHRSFPSVSDNDCQGKAPVPARRRGGGAAPASRACRQAGSRRSYACRRRLQPSQKGTGSVPVARATSTSRCMCQPAATPSSVGRSGRRRWMMVSSTSVPWGSSAKVTSP